MRITITLDETERDALHELAKNNKVSMSKWIRNKIHAAKAIADFQRMKKEGHEEVTHVSEPE